MLETASDNNGSSLQEMKILSENTTDALRNVEPEAIVHHDGIRQGELSPADTGRAAWLALLSCSIIQIPVWGNMTSATKSNSNTNTIN